MTGDIITSYTLGKSYDLLAVGNEVKSESFLRAFQFTFRLLWLLREIPYLAGVVRLLGKGVGRWCGGLGVIPTLLRWQWVSICQPISFAESEHPDSRQEQSNREKLTS